MVLQENSPYAGFVINPFSENIVVSREIMLNINKHVRLKKEVQIPREENMPGGRLLPLQTRDWRFQPNTL